MSYKHDMSNEKKPKTKMLLAEGWRKFKLVHVEEQTSKKGNQMFVIDAEDKETGYVDTWFAISEPKKRWFLKLILSSCGCAASEDGVYDWDIPDIIGKSVEGLCVHEDNKWINRDGDEVVTQQHKVVDIRECEQDAVDETIPWDSE